MSFDFWCFLASLNICIIYVFPDFYLNWAALGVSVVQTMRLWKSNNQQNNNLEN